MARISLDEFRTNRVEDLMNQFFFYENKVRELAGNGERFTTVLEWQKQAADIIHDVDDEGLLHLAKDMYPWEKDTIKSYLEIYDEIQSGVKL